MTEFHGYNGDLLTVIVDGLRFREGYDSHVALPSHNGLVLGPLLGLISGFGIGIVKSYSVLNALFILIMAVTYYLFINHFDASLPWPIKILIIYSGLLWGFPQMGGVYYDLVSSLFGFLGCTLLMIYSSRNIFWHFIARLGLV